MPKTIKRHSFKAWAIVNDETGRVMLTDISHGGPRMEKPEIWMTKIGAEHHKRDDERLVRVIVMEE